MAEDSVAAILVRAVLLVAAAEDGDDFDAVWDVLRPLRDQSDEAFAAATRLLSGDADDQQVGLGVLAVLCNPDEEDWGYFDGGRDNPLVAWSVPPSTLEVR